MKNKTTYKSATIGALLFITCMILYVLNSTVGNKEIGVNELKDIESLKASTPINFNIPSYIEDKFTENTVYQNNSNFILTIYDSDFALKIASFVDVNADVLALYDSADIDSKYTVTDSEITYFRVRQGYKEYPNSTIINWCTDETSYGLIIEDKITYTQVVNMLELDRFYIESVQDTEHKVENTEVEFEEYKFNNSVTLSVPVISSEIQSLEIDGATTLFIDHKLVAVIVYNDYDLMAGTYDNMNSITRDDGIKVYYNTENPFNPDSITYRDYEMFINTIEDICKSIIYTKN